MRNSRIILYLPELAAAMRTAHVRGLPVLDKLVTRARPRPVTGAVQLLREHFALRAQEFPTAALERLGYTGVRDEGFWWRADPAHLLVDRDQLAMLPRAGLGVSADEAQALAASFNATYASDGLVLETPEPQVWYLRVPMAWHCHTWDPALVEGQAITEFMPAGADEDALKKLMNEVQMLFYEHPVNQARELGGKLAINSLWLWGGGTLPERLEHAPARVIGNLPIVRGLAALGGRTCEPWPAELTKFAGEAEVFIGASLHDFAGNPLRLDAELLQPCWRALLRGKVRALEFFVGGAYAHVLPRAAALRLWRRPQAALSQLGDVGAEAAD